MQKDVHPSVQDALTKFGLEKRIARYLQEIEEKFNNDFTWPTLIETLQEEYGDAHRYLLQKCCLHA